MDSEDELETSDAVSDDVASESSFEKLLRMSVYTLRFVS